jgi:hypothetical protein
LEKIGRTAVGYETEKPLLRGQELSEHRAPMDFKEDSVIDVSAGKAVTDNKGAEEGTIGEI